MSAGWPRNVIVTNRATERFAQHLGSLQIGREYRSVATLRLRSGVSSPCLYVSLRCGKERDREGI